MKIIYDEMRKTSVSLRNINEGENTNTRKEKKNYLGLICLELNDYFRTFQSTSLWH